MKRCAFFSFVFLVCFLWYILLEEGEGKLKEGLSFVSKDIPPLIFWILFLGYILFPHKTLFNGQGRIFVLKMIKDFLMMKTDAKSIWFMTNMLSFAIAIKDLTYVFCYYPIYFAKGREEVGQCLSSISGTIVGLIIINLPCVVAIVQVIFLEKLI